jgi:hypothetical protein
MTLQCLIVTALVILAALALLFYLVTSQKNS